MNVRRRGERTDVSRSDHSAKIKSGAPLAPQIASAPMLGRSYSPFVGFMVLDVKEMVVPEDSLWMRVAGVGRLT